MQIFDSWGGQLPPREWDRCGQLVLLLVLVPPLSQVEGSTCTLPIAVPFQTLPLVLFSLLLVHDWLSPVGASQYCTSTPACGQGLLVEIRV